MEGEIIKAEKISSDTYSSYTGIARKDEFNVTMENVILAFDLVLDEITSENPTIGMEIIEYIREKFNEANENLMIDDEVEATLQDHEDIGLGELAIQLLADLHNQISFGYRHRSISLFNREVPRIKGAMKFD